MNFYCYLLKKANFKIGQRKFDLNMEKLGIHIKEFLPETSYFTSKNAIFWKWISAHLDAKLWPITRIFMFLNKVYLDAHSVIKSKLFFYYTEVEKTPSLISDIVVKHCINIILLSLLPQILKSLVV
jgi:hypothetical protein